MFFSEDEIIRQKIVDQEQIIKSADGLITMAMNEKATASEKILTLQSQLRKQKKAAGQTAL